MTVARYFFPARLSVTTKICEGTSTERQTRGERQRYPLIHCAPQVTSATEDARAPWVKTVVRERQARRRPRHLYNKLLGGLCCRHQRRIFRARQDSHGRCSVGCGQEQGRARSTGLSCYQRPGTRWRLALLRRIRDYGDTMDAGKEHEALRQHRHERQHRRQQKGTGTPASRTSPAVWIGLCANWS